MSSNRSFKGKVILIGAGPGDPGLLTVRGREYIQQADILVYDHLVNKEILDLAPTTARRIYVGKVSGHHTVSQDAIQEILVREARAGHAVARLKGGDPFIFGRGAEECEYLRDRGIEFEIVPGVSAVSAVPSYAGIPITSRDASSVFIAVTGHEHNEKSGANVDWETLAKIEGTLIVFMGIYRIRSIADELLGYGKSPQTPTAVIRRGTCAQQETITGTLETIADRAEQAGMRPPGLIVIGEVVRLREKLQWFESISKSFDPEH